MQCVLIVLYAFVGAGVAVVLAYNVRAYNFSILSRWVAIYCTMYMYVRVKARSIILSLLLLLCHWHECARFRECDIELKIDR